MIVQGSRNVLTTARNQPDVCDVTQSQLLFAAPQRSVIRLRALGFQRRSVGIKTPRIHARPYLLRQTTDVHDVSHPMSACAGGGWYGWWL